MKKISFVVVGAVIFLAFLLGHIVGERDGYRRGVDAALDAFDCITDLEVGRVQPPHTRERCKALGIGDGQGGWA